MSETLVAAPSTAEVDVFNGEQPSMAEYTQYRQSGELPERFKPADTVDPAPAEETTEVEETESASESETGEQQQEKKPKGKTAEDRIAQLEATIEKIKRGAGLERKTESAPVTEPAKASAPQNYQDYRKTFNADEWMGEYAKTNPDAGYADATAAMADHLADVRDQFRGIEQQRQSQAKELNDKVVDARARYGEKFDEVLQPTLQSIVGDAKISPVIKELLNDSPVVADLLFTIGEDEAIHAKFLALAKNKPGEAIRYLAVVEAGIIEELSGNKANETPRDEDGKFKSAAPPAKPKTSAPKPPSPVSGASTGAFDVSDDSLSAEEWMRKRNEQVSKR